MANGTDTLQNAARHVGGTCGQLPRELRAPQLERAETGGQVGATVGSSVRGQRTRSGRLQPPDRGVGVRTPDADRGAYTL